MDLALDYVKNVLTWENRNTKESIRQYEFIKEYLSKNYTYDLQLQNMGLFCKIYLLQEPEVIKASNYYFPYLAWRNFELELPNGWFFDPEYKWVIYSLIKDFLRTANIDIYLKLIEMFKTLNELKDHHPHAEFITEHSYVEYPPIADFFRACCGKPVYGNYFYERKYKRVRLERYNRGYEEKDISKTKFYKLALISTELPELIQSYVNFDIREEVRSVLNNDKFKQSEPILQTILEYLGYEVEVEKTFENGEYKTNWYLDYQEEKELENNLISSPSFPIVTRYLYYNNINGKDHLAVKEPDFEYHLEEYLKYETKKLRLCLIGTGIKQYNRNWSNKVLIAKNLTSGGHKSLVELRKKDPYSNKYVKDYSNIEKYELYFQYRGAERERVNDTDDEDSD